MKQSSLEGTTNLSTRNSKLHDFKEGFLVVLKYVDEHPCEGFLKIPMSVFFLDTLYSLSEMGFVHWFLLKVKSVESKMIELNGQMIN